MIRRRRASVIRGTSFALGLAALATPAALAAGAPGGINWTRQYGGSFNDAGWHIAADAAGNAYVAGFAATSANGSDHQAVLRKYDAAGNLVWHRNPSVGVNPRANGIGVDLLGNSYISGEMSGDAFVSKHDTSGNHVWSRQIGSVTGPTEAAFGAAPDAAGNVYVVGWTNGNLGTGIAGGNFDAFVRKYDAAGNLQWTSQFGSDGSDAAYGVNVDPAGNVIVGGMQNTVGDAGWNNTVVRKYSPAGSLLGERIRNSGDEGDDQVAAVATDAAGNVYATGMTSGALAGPGSSGGDYDVFLMKYDASGALVWTKQSGNPNFDYADAVAVDAAGNAYLAGHYAGGFDTTFHGGMDAALLAYDAAGTRLWVQGFGTAAEEEGRGVALTPDGSLAYVTGFTKGNLAGTNAGPGFSDAFLASINVPEPAAASILAAAWTCLGMRRRRAARPAP